MNNKLGKYSSEELLAELEKRKQPVPVPLQNPDFTRLTKLVIDYIENKEDDEDMAHWMYEAAVEAVYGSGSDIWNYINSWNH